MRFCCFYLTGKQHKKRGDFDHWADYERYVTSLIEIGDSVKVLCDWYSDEGVRQGQTGVVVSDVWKYAYGYDCVTVQFDDVADDVGVWCTWIEILN